MNKSLIGAIGLALVLAVAVIGNSRGQPQQSQRTAHSSVFIYAAVNDDPNGFTVWDYSTSGPDVPHIERGTPLSEFDAQARDAGFVLQPQVHSLVLHYVR